MGREKEIRVTSGRSNQQVRAAKFPNEDNSEIRLKGGRLTPTLGNARVTRASGGGWDCGKATCIVWGRARSRKVAQHAGRNPYGCLVLPWRGGKGAAVPGFLRME